VNCHTLAAEALIRQKRGLQGPIDESSVDFGPGHAELLEILQNNCLIKILLNTEHVVCIVRTDCSACSSAKIFNDVECSHWTYGSTLTVSTESMTFSCSRPRMFLGLNITIKEVSFLQGQSCSLIYVLKSELPLWHDRHTLYHDIPVRS
jgi:hypothetical protein